MAIPQIYIDNVPQPPTSTLTPLQIALAASMVNGQELPFNVNIEFAKEMARFASSEKWYPAEIDPNTGRPNRINAIPAITGTDLVIIGEDVYLKRIAENCGPDETVRYENEYLGKRINIAEGTYALYGKLIFRGRIGAAGGDYGFGQVGDGGGGGDGCFLTTATVKHMGLPDDCEELELARWLRDNYMTSPSDSLAKDLYDYIGPLLLEKDIDWKIFYSSTILPMSYLIKNKEYHKATLLYKYATLQLIDRYLTSIKDRNIIEKIYDSKFQKGQNLHYIFKYISVKILINYKLTLGMLLKNGILDPNKRKNR